MAEAGTAEPRRARADQAAPTPSVRLQMRTPRSGKRFAAPAARMSLLLRRLHMRRLRSRDPRLRRHRAARAVSETARVGSRPSPPSLPSTRTLTRLTRTRLSPPRLTRTRPTLTQAHSRRSTRLPLASHPMASPRLEASPPVSQPGPHASPARWPPSASSRRTEATTPQACAPLVANPSRQQACSRGDDPPAMATPRQPWKARQPAWKAARPLQGARPLRPGRVGRHAGGRRRVGTSSLSSQRPSPPRPASAASRWRRRRSAVGCTRCRAASPTRSSTFRAARPSTARGRRSAAQTHGGR